MQGFAMTLCIVQLALSTDVNNTIFINKTNETYRRVLDATDHIKYRTRYLYSLVEGYGIVAQAYHQANESFFRANRFFDVLKNEALIVVNKYLDAIKEFNTRRAKAVKQSMMEKYNKEPLKGFTKENMSLEEVEDYVNLCLLEPEQTELHIRSTFSKFLDNFHDTRHFETVNVCGEYLPDEISTAQCIIHKSVILKYAFNDHSLEVLSTKAEEFVKTVNSSVPVLEKCLDTFIPNFTGQIKYFDKNEDKETMYALANDLLLTEIQYNDEHFGEVVNDMTMFTTSLPKEENVAKKRRLGES